MHIVYLCNFNITRKSGGKDRATRQKIESLKKYSNGFKAYFLKREGRAYKLCFGAILDVKCAFYILTKKPDILISRGATGFFSFIIAKKLGVLTVREVHAIADDEASLLPYKGFKAKLIAAIGRYNSMMNLWADVRIFNHPFLLDYFRGKRLCSEYDFYCYNGHGDNVVVDIAPTDARRKYGLSGDFRYLVFTGSVSEWHGAEYLVALQERFDEYGDKVKVVVGGGDMRKYDSKNICLNFSPLDEVGCSELIAAADVCLIPVKNNRISPGSPLKLYDYIAHKKYIVAQDMVGYSDEVERYGVGIIVDFENADETRNEIVMFLDELSKRAVAYPEPTVSWDDRIQYWMLNLNRVLHLKRKS